MQPSGSNFDRGLSQWILGNHTDCGDFGTVSSYSSVFFYLVCLRAQDLSLHLHHEYVGRMTTPLYEDNHVESPLQTKKGGFKGGEKGEGDKLCIGILGIPDC